ncbi:hypothetical protein ACIRBX_19495 [Kitasatospora sp. NPDC096147]|uniref:hypothetical protein n=1 Tax=Kitasatospora sp. NPDC096147 TaxID=3364093 RepID=UPI00382875B6
MLNAQRDAVTTSLEPGERLLEAAAVTLAPGIPHPPAELLAPRRVSPVEEGLGRSFGLLRRAYAVVNPVSAAVGAIENRVVAAEPERVLHGAGIGGGWQSAAGRLVIRLHEGGAKGGGLLAVTDRRLLVVVDRAALWQLFTEEYALHWAVPRAEVREVRRHATGVLQRGRIDLHFADGSWVAVTADLPRAADPVVAAFHS